MTVHASHRRGYASKRETCVMGGWCLHPSRMFAPPPVHLHAVHPEHAAPHFLFCTAYAVPCLSVWLTRWHTPLRLSLGGNTKTVMCANAGPAEYNYDETVSTLRWVLDTTCDAVRSSRRRGGGDMPSSQDARQSFCVTLGAVVCDCLVRTINSLLKMFDP